jgi:hypothetical protein
MADEFIGEARSLTSPATHAAVVNLAADTDLSGQPSRGVLINGAGNLKVDTLGGEIGVIIPCPVGFLSIRLKKIYSTANGTTATGITLLW